MKSLAKTDQSTLPIPLQLQNQNQNKSIALSGNTKPQGQRGVALWMEQAFLDDQPHPQEW